MRIFTSLATAALGLSFNVVLAQTPLGFSPAVAENLGAYFSSSNTTISPPGILIPRSVLLPPASANTTNSTLYMVFMIDLDVPLNSSAPNATRRTLLHWFQPSLIASDNMLISNTTDEEGAPYIMPSPPPLSGPHRYTLLLFLQPSNFTVPVSFASVDPPANTTARIGFNVSEFVSAAGLANPIAGNYFQVLNGTAAETSSVTISVPLVTGTRTTTAASLTETSTSTGGASASASATESASAGGAVIVGAGGRELLVAGGMGLFGALMWLL